MEPRDGAPGGERHARHGSRDGDNDRHHHGWQRVRTPGGLLNLHIDVLLAASVTGAH